MATAAERARLDRALGAMHHGGLDQAADGYVYFALCGGFVKIGHTFDVTERMATLQTGNPHEIVLLASVAGTRRSEQCIHAHFAVDRHRGEWFRDSAELRLYILEQATTHAVRR